MDGLTEDLAAKDRARRHSPAPSRNMRRRTFIAALGGAAAWPLAVQAQASTLSQVGILDPGFPHHFDAFRRGMRDVGYVEGQNVSFIYRSAAGRAEGIRALASELVGLKPHVIVTASPLASFSSSL